ncbi:MAG: outer membrane protein [Rhodospirillales bacterium]|jgi:putative membrane protein|nr:outer membrane protein [Rhodospirillales bacterium]
MKTTITLAAGMALLLSTASVWAQNAGSGAVQPSAPPAPQQGVATGAVSPPTASARSPEATRPVGTRASSASLNATDKLFVKQATAGGLAEVQEGQLAQNQAQSPDVKAFGQHMVSDHTAAAQKLKAIVDAEGLAAPTDVDKADQKQIDALQKQSGARFDKQYVKDQVAAHKKTVALFQKEAKSGSDPQLKQFASDTLPTLQQHLSAVEALPQK